ncbi:MAG: SixA phosphatase family protein [Rhodospirillales bacterium]
MPKRTLILWRHAKAGPGGPERSDFDRPLAEQGRRDALAMAAFIIKHLPRPGLILCSPARRTRETLEPLAALLNPEPPVRFLETIYEAAPETLLAELRGAGDAETVLMLGHNPGMQMLALNLADGGGNSLAGGFSAGAAAVLESETEWKNLSPGGARLALFTGPGDL